MTKYTAAVIGLGRVGLRFDLEEKRKAVWTHTGAYLARADRIELLAGCDPDADCRRLFEERCPGAQTFASAEEMFSALRPEVVSICTPVGTHAHVLEKVIAAGGCRVAVVEKPFCRDPESRRALAAKTADGGLTVAVHYSRRWSRMYRRCREILDRGELGDLLCVHVRAPNRLWSVGPHAADQLVYFGGAVRDLVAMHHGALDERGEPACAALVEFEGGACGSLTLAGYRRHLLFEVDVVGSRGRLEITDHERSARFRRFIGHPEYAGYDALEPNGERLVADPAESTFVNLVDDVIDHLDGNPKRLTCLPADALATEWVLDRMAEAAV